MTDRSLTCPACGHRDAEELVCRPCADRGETVWLTAREGWMPVRVPEGVTVH